MNISDHSFTTTFGAPPVFGGAPARGSEVYHLTVDGAHVASLHAIRAPGESCIVRAAVTIAWHRAPKDSYPKAAPSHAAQALSLTREIEDFRDGSLPDHATRVQKCRDDAHAGDGLPRALLILDRLTGSLHQRALPMPREEMRDGADRYEVIGFAVLERGAQVNREIGDASAYFASPQFAEKKAARLTRKHQQDARSDGFQVRRNRHEVSLGESSPIPAIASVDSDSRLDSLRTLLAERRQAGASDHDLRAIVAQEIRWLQPGIDSDTVSALAAHAVSQLPTPDERGSLPEPPAPRFTPMPREIMELVKLWACAVCASNYADATLEPLGMPSACPEFSPHDYATAYQLGRALPLGRVALLIGDSAA